MMMFRLVPMDLVKKKKAEKTQTVLEIRLSEKMPLTEGFTVPGQIRLDIVAQT
jgi:hypothetical protein